MFFLQLLNIIIFVLVTFYWYKLLVDLIVDMNYIGLFIRLDFAKGLLLKL